MLLFKLPVLFLPQTVVTYCKKSEKYRDRREDGKLRGERRLGSTTARLMHSSNGVLGTMHH
jgi:hypothetical protein